MAWPAAEAWAASLGGHLVSIDDQAEQDWLVATFGTPTVRWIGLYDELNDDTFAWVNGDAVGYTNWYSRLSLRQFAEP